jgi:hypothetical protein
MDELRTPEGSLRIETGARTVSAFNSGTCGLSWPRNAEFNYERFFWLSLQCQALLELVFDTAPDQLLCSFEALYFDCDGAFDSIRKPNEYFFSILHLVHNGLLFLRFKDCFDDAALLAVLASTETMAFHLALDDRDGKTIAFFGATAHQVASQIVWHLCGMIPGSLDHERPDCRDAVREAVDSMRAAVERADVQHLLAKLERERLYIVAKRQRGAAEVQNETAKPEFIFAPDGDGYFIRGLGGEGHFQRLKGFNCISRLIQELGKPVAMAELISDFGKVTAGQESSYQDVLDDEARRNYRERLRQAKSDLAQAETEGDHTTAVESRDEIEFVENELKSSTGIGLRQRNLNDTTKNWGPTIHGNLKTAYKKLRDGGLANLAEHFEAAISSESGAFIYRPAGMSIEWQFQKKVRQ